MNTEREITSDFGCAAIEKNFLRLRCGPTLTNFYLLSNKHFFVSEMVFKAIRACRILFFKLGLTLSKMCRKQKLCKSIKMKAPEGFEPSISCLLDRRFNQLSHGAARYTQLSLYINYFPSILSVHMHTTYVHLDCNLNVEVQFQCNPITL